MLDQKETRDMCFINSIFSPFTLSEPCMESSRTLCWCYAVEISYYITGGHRGFQLIGTWISSLLDANDIVLIIVDSYEGLYCHFDTLRSVILHSYIYLGAVFTGLVFSMREKAHA